MHDFLQILLFIIPAYIANAVPVVLGGGQYLDFGKNFFDGERIFGNGKTIRGFIAGVASGVVAAGAFAIYLPNPYYASTQIQFLGGVALSFGTMVGDAAGSFVKRRLKVQPGKPFLLDQISFLLVALILVYPFADQLIFSPLPLIFLFVLTYILHPTANFIANKLGLKSVPW